MPTDSWPPAARATPSFSARSTRPPRPATMLLAEIVETSAAVGGTAARLEKIDRLATTLKRVEPGEASIAAAYLSSRLRQRQIGVGYASMRDLPPPAAGSTLTLSDV